MTRPDDGDLEAALREALAADADGITPADRLAVIRARTESLDPTDTRWRGWGVSLLAAAAVIGMVFLGLQWRGPAPHDPAGGALAGTSSSAATDSHPSSATAPSHLGRPAGKTVPAFALARITEPSSSNRATPVQRWALQRWFVTSDLPKSAPAPLAVRAAVRYAMGMGTLDPGQSLPLESVAATAVEVTPSLITISMSSGGTPVADAEIARLSVQQLVWTAQAAYGHRVPVTFRLQDGGRLLLGRFPAADRYDRPDSDRIAADVAPVWIDQPSPGATIAAGRPVRLTGLADVPDGKLVWSLTRARDARGGESTAHPPPTVGPAGPEAPTEKPMASGTVRADQATEGGPPAQRRFTAELPALEPGRYRLDVGYPAPGSGPVMGVASVDLVVP